MKQFKALLIKEWNTHWTMLLTPAWLTLGVLLITLIGFIIAWANGMSGFNPGTDVLNINADYRSLILWLANAFGASFLGFVAMLTAASLADAQLNGGFKRKCEIFHLSQPVGLEKILLSKYLFMVLGTFLQIAVIALVVGFGATLYVNSYLKVDLVYAFNGMALGLLSIFLPLLFVSSFAWFWAGAFKRNYVVMTIVIISALEIARALLNYFAHLSIPSVTAYLFELAGANVSIKFNNLNTVAQDVNAYAVIREAWSKLISVHALQQIIWSVVLFLGGSWFYSRREIS